MSGPSRPKRVKSILRGAQGADAPEDLGILRAERAVRATEDAFADIHARLTSACRSFGDTDSLIKDEEKKGRDWKAKLAALPFIRAKVSRALYDYKVGRKRWEILSTYDPWPPTQALALKDLYKRADGYVRSLHLEAQTCKGRKEKYPRVTHLRGEEVWPASPGEEAWNSRGTQTLVVTQESSLSVEVSASSGRRTATAASAPREQRNLRLSESSSTEDEEDLLAELLASTDDDEPPKRRRRRDSPGREVAYVRNADKANPDGHGRGRAPTVRTPNKR